MSIKEMSLKLAAISLIADEAKKAKDKLRAELQVEMDSLGADRVKAELGDEVVAYVMTTKPKEKPVILNEKKFVEWVEANCADELIKTVRPSSVDRILDKCFKNVDDEAVVDWNGEEVDFIAYESKEPYLTTKFAGDGRETIRRAIVSNSIDARKVLEIE